MRYVIWKWKDMWELEVYIPKWKKSIWKGYILYDPSVHILEKAKLSIWQIDQWLSEIQCGVKGVYSIEYTKHREFLQWGNSYDTVIVMHELVHFQNL